MDATCVGLGAGVPPLDLERRVAEQLRAAHSEDDVVQGISISVGRAMLEPWDSGDLDRMLWLADRSFGEGGLRTIYWDIFYVTSFNAPQAGYGKYRAGLLGWGVELYELRPEPDRSGKDRPGRALEPGAPGVPGAPRPRP